MKKTGVTKKKRVRKHERKKEPWPQDVPRKISGTFLVFQKTDSGGPSEQQLQAERRFLRVVEGLFRRTDTYQKAILYSGKLSQTWDNPRTVAKYLAEELRAFLPYGAALLMKEVEWHWNVKGFVPEMLKALAEYLKDEQPVFRKVDYKIVDIVEQHPNCTVKDITSELYPQLHEQYSDQKWNALTRHVQRFLKNVPWLRG
jgi:hypothetical protein